MINFNKEYWVRNPIRTTAVQPPVQGGRRLAETPDEHLSRTYLDTFDWSVYLAGATLEWRNIPLQPVLIWTGLERTEDTRLQVTPTEPAFPVDLAPGPVRKRLLQIIHLRRLLPVMRVDSRIRHLHLCGAEDRTVALLEFEESRFQDPRGGGEGDLLPRLRILPVPGHEDEAVALLDTLGDELGLEQADAPLLLEALAAAGREPADYSAKRTDRVDPEARADTVAKEILLGLLATLEANLDGARANLDSEFLHDLRVATRRTRSALSHIRGVFPDAQVARFKEEFTWLQLVTGPVRDLDVYLLEFDAYQHGLPADLGADLEPLRAFLHARYAAEQERLAHTLGSARFTRLLADWRLFLETPIPQPDTTANGARPIAEVAERRIRALAKRVRREGRLIGPDSPPEDLHELRKSCKKLRYLMEFFQSLYPKDEIRGLIGLLKALLDNLGGYQDLAVQAAHLRDLAQQMRDEDRAETSTLLAIGALIGTLHTHQQQTRDAFDQVFSGFQGKENQRVFRRLFSERRSSRGQ